MSKDPFRNHDSMALPKRKRIVTSCNQCRKKKVKCDKSRPVCGGCVKNGIPDQCLYQEPSWGGNDINLSSNYTVAASIPMAHITVDSSRKPSASPDHQDQNHNNQQPQPMQIHVQQMETRPIKKHKQEPTLQQQLQHPSNQYSQHQGALPSVGQSYSPLNNNGHTPPPPTQFTYGPNQPSIMGPAVPYSDNLFKLREKVQYMESNLRQESPHNSNVNTPHNKSSIGSAATFPSPSNQAHYMSFYDYREPVQVRAGRLIAAGPLSFNSLIRKDPYLKVILLKIRKQKRILAIPWKDRTIKASELVNEIILEEKGIKNTRSKHIDEKFKATLIQNEGIDEVKSKKDAPESSRLDYESETILRIEEALPEEKLLWILVDRFFDGVLAAFLPFISETTFREKIQEIIGCRKDEKRKIPNLTITKRFDFAYIGELLIILRLTYLSVTKTSNNTLQEQYILRSPIGMNVVKAAEMCLNQFKILRRGALPVIQFSLFMRFYHKFAPEDGDGSDGGDSQVFLGMILQMGNSIGLNRDLTHSDRLKTHSRIVNLWRMIWHEIVTLDLHQSLHMGNPILVDENYFDTLLPLLESKVEDYTLKNFDIHQAVIKNFEINNELNKFIRDILKDVLNINRVVNIDELFPKLARLESFIDEQFVSIEAIYGLKNYTIQDTIFKIYKFINYIELKTALFILYYNIYINNPRSNFPILIKILTFSMELSPLAYLMITTNNEKTNYFDSIFGSGSQLLILPSITLSLQKVHKLLIALISRCLDLKYNYPKTHNSSTFEQIRIALMKTLDVILNGYQTLSSDYYQAWRFCKGSVYIFNLLSDLDNNLFDKGSKMNLECIEGNVIDELNHYKNIPSFNELTDLSEPQIQQLYDLVHTERFKNSLLQWLNKRSKPSSRPSSKNTFKSSTNVPQPPSPSISQKPNAVSDPQFARANSETTSSVGSVDGSSVLNSSNGLHVNKNTMTNVEIDRLWFQIMAANNESAESVLFDGRINNAILNPNSGTNQSGNGVHHTASSATTNRNISQSASSDGPGLDEENVHLNTEFLGFGPLGDLEKLMGDEDAGFDMFGDIPFFNEG